MRRLGLVLLLVMSLGVNGAAAASKIKPSPSPKWPPAGFKSNGEVYAKIPTAKKPPKLLRKRPLLIPPNIASQSLLDSRYWEAAQSVHFDYSQR